MNEEEQVRVVDMVGSNGAISDALAIGTQLSVDTAMAMRLVIVAMFLDRARGSDITDAEARTCEEYIRLVLPARKTAELVAINPTPRGH